MSPKDFQTIRHALSHIEYALPGLSDAHEALTRIDRQAKTLSDWAVLCEDTNTDWLKGYEAARAWVCMQLGLSGPPAEISGAPVAAASDAPPKASWEDSRTQKVYEVLVNDNYPPRGSAEHWEGWKARLVVDALFPEQAQAEAVRIYDYVWPQTKEHADECIYACSYTPAGPLAAGKLFAVVHPSQIPNSYLQREGDAPPTSAGAAPPQAEAVPEWLTYDPATDVLTIHGKRYSAGMFGEEGFLAPVGTLLRVEDGGPGVVMLARVQEAEAVPQCAQCKKPYRKGAATAGCPKCAPGVVVSEAEFRQPIAPQGYALVSINALKAWGKYDEVQAACQYPVSEPRVCPTCDDVGFCIKPSECAKEIERMQGGDL